MDDNASFLDIFNSNLTLNMTDLDLNYCKNLKIETTNVSPIEAKTYLAKCKNKFSLLNIKTRETNWELVSETENINGAYDVFLRMFINLYEKSFPRKKRAKKNYYAGQIAKSIGNTKKTWSVIKKIIDKTKDNIEKFPKQLIIENGLTLQKDKIANKFNEFFINVGPKLAAKIPSTTKTHSSYLDTCDTNEQFPDQLKNARVAPKFKSGENSDVTNYRPISVLPCFSKVLQRIMYNRLDDHLVQNNILYDKQFGFQKHHSTDNAVIELVSELSESFNKRLFTLGIFIDLSKAFDTVNHILLSKLKSYGVQSNNLKWFTNYLTNRKQCIAYDDKLTLFQLIKCGAQGSILGPLLFLIYINDLHNSSKMLRFILFADDANLFYSHTNIVDLFKTANQELAHINEWFKANKLSLNISKTKYVLFYNRYKTDNIPLKLPSLKINNVNIKNNSLEKSSD
ncbi:uncharacterized protein LOC130636914 [Hydractinia symbiolongicarpus]|uniref:uncharacterized protein LOC130636914 n=1 Tax=Hydractinia symbiolongicarpus TaxID=13093 RepID=UPI00254BE08A|nr:uncharacterized protein LOC130636914 [Hydractinia symbiolongicarpus]